MLRKVLVIAAPLALVLVLELLFQIGLWEPLAKPASHAGTSIRLKQKLTDPALPHIDFVTLGSSRPEYGIGHASIARTAQRSGLVHADLTMPGSHWMTIGVISRWLRRTHPEIRGGLIALSIQDFMNAGNGDYELGIVYPFRRLTDVPWIAEHVPFDRDDVGSYGTWSALFEWRTDIQSFVRDPAARLASIKWYRTHRSSTTSLFTNPESHGDMCAFGLGTLTACDRVDASAGASHDRFEGQCKVLRNLAKGRHDYSGIADDANVPSSMPHVRDLVRTQLRDLQWPHPPIVVLMPMPVLWQRDVLGQGLHAWALEVLRPLVESGTIAVIDATGFFDQDADAGCSAFFDFYHQNSTGRARFTRWLLPQLQRLLYQEPAGQNLSDRPFHSPVDP